MKTKIEKRKLSSVIVAVVCLLSVVSLTLAMFSRSVSVDRLFSVSNFGSEVVVSFGESNIISKDEKKNGIKVSFNALDANYIGNLRVGVKYWGYGVGLIRVRVIEQWSTVDDENKVRHILPYSINMPYIIDESYDGTGNKKAWYDNREEDYRFYYATPVTSSSDKGATISMITGFDVDSIDTGVMDQGTELHIVVETEVVQVNRYPQFWGMTKLPWTDGISATEEKISNLWGEDP